MELQHTRGSTVGGATSRGARREAPAVAVNPEHAFRDGFGPRRAAHATASIEAALRSRSSRRAAFPASARSGCCSTARAEAAGSTARRWPTRYTGSTSQRARRRWMRSSRVTTARATARGSAPRISASGFLAPDFPTAAEKAKRRADGVVSAFRRAFKDEVSRRRDDGIDEDDDAATVSTRDALSAAPARRRRRSAGRSARPPRRARGGGDVPGRFRSRARRGFRRGVPAEHTRGGGPGSKTRAVSRAHRVRSAAGASTTRARSARGRAPFPAKPDVARFLRMARDRPRGARAPQGSLRDHEMRASVRPGPARVRHAGQLPRAMASLGLDAIDEETFAKTFARVGARLTTRLAERRPPPSAARRRSSRAFLPARVAVDRRARGAVLAALEQSEAATEAERAALEACDVDVEDPARVARLVRLGRRNGKNEASRTRPRRRG